jgi:hypothetical protein
MLVTHGTLKKTLYSRRTDAKSFMWTKQSNITYNCNKIILNRQNKCLSLLKCCEAMAAASMTSYREFPDSPHNFDYVTQRRPRKQ